MQVKQAVMVSMSSHDKTCHNCFCNIFEKSSSVLILWPNIKLTHVKRMAIILFIKLARNSVLPIFLMFIWLPRDIRSYSMS